MATNEQMKTEFSFFSEVWTLFKKYYEVQDSDSYWEAVVNEAADINERYRSLLCKDLLISILRELERKSKDIQKMPQNDT